MGNCNNPINETGEGAMGFYSDKVFPEEVDNIKEFMHDTFTTNINAFSLMNSSEKLKGNMENELNNNTNFLQDDEINVSNDYYNQQDNRMGIDSASLNKRYFNNLNKRRLQKNFIDENENYMDNKQEEEKNQNYQSKRYRNEDSSNHRNSRINKASDEKANVKNHNEMNAMIQKNNEKSQTHRGNLNDKVNKKEVIDKNENHEKEEEVNNHRMLRKLR